MAQTGWQFDGGGPAVTALDALESARGAMVFCIEAGKVAWTVDASAALRLFAADAAERALMRERKAGSEPDPRSWMAIEVTRRYARGDATLTELRRARDAAMDAAGDAAMDASWAAAGDVSGIAARAAARAAAWDAVWDAAWDAARAAAEGAVLYAARGAASDVAWDGERAWQEKALVKRLRALAPR